MYITELPQRAIQLSTDGQHVVLMEYEQRMFLMWLMANRRDLVEQCGKVR